MKTLRLKKLKMLGHKDPKYCQWRMTDEEMKRKDISPRKMYLVQYNGTWLLGRFGMQWYGWNFDPNLGAMSMQINDLDAIYEVKGLSQKKAGNTAEHILGYLITDEDVECDEDY